MLTDTIPDHALKDSLRATLALTNLFCGAGQEALDGWPLSDADLEALSVARWDAYNALQSLDAIVARTQRVREAQDAD